LDIPKGLKLFHCNTVSGKLTPLACGKRSLRADSIDMEKKLSQDSQSYVMCRDCKVGRKNSALVAEKDRDVTFRSRTLGLANQARDESMAKKAKREKNNVRNKAEVHG